MAVTDEAIQQIKAMIVSGELAPGDRLPPEKELADRLGLSRSSMREAVKALEVIRVLDVRRGDGTYVTSLQPNLLLEAISFVIDMHNDDSLLEIFAVRRILESQATGMATAHLTTDDFAVLRADIEATTPDLSVDEIVAHDSRFHTHIVDRAGNAYLSSLINSLTTQTVRARAWRGLTQAGAVERTIAEHAGILDALERGDATLAASLTAAHISGVESWLRSARDASRGTGA